ncbi:hypothetical protein ACX8Z9_04710 [Arthrobacter halodurans]|uniref:LysR substrate binding domain-containing protein n=1 Tax=Arthrobacter halodurans TaxID=516699 RepID=A0ABV4UPX6_9MICC
MDENFAIQVSSHLKNMLPSHQFLTTNELGLEGEKDLQLFPKLKNLEIDAIVTHDLRHMEDADETMSLFENNMHWIGMKQTRQGTAGVTAIALQSAALLSALPMILGDWRTEPTMYKVIGIQRAPQDRFRARALSDVVRTHALRRART